MGFERGYEKNVALKGGFRRKKILGLMGVTKNDCCNNSSSLPECHLGRKWGPRKKNSMKKRVPHVLQELSVESDHRSPLLQLRNERSLINGRVFSPWSLPHSIMYHSKSFVTVAV